VSPVIRVKTFLAPDQGCALTRIEEALWHLGQIYPIPAPTMRWLEEEDWADAWKAGYKVFRVGRRLVIKPSWLSWDAAPEDIPIELDPGMAFGTGLHPSTRLVLEALESQVKPGARVLDVGTGSGILAIAAVKLGAGHVLGIDIDRLALDVAQENIARNGVQDRIALQRASLIPPAVSGDCERSPDLFDVRGRWNGAFDLLLMNILADVIIRSAEPMAAALAEDGLFIVSGIIQVQEELVRRALSAAGLRVAKRRTRKDWVALIGKKESRTKDAI
jgi:ribosomal protein L11 methyltransferase